MRNYVHCAFQSGILAVILHKFLIMAAPGSAADLSAIGTHCEYAKCSRLDFLPFKCANCRATFCLDHRQRTAHDCTAVDSSANRDKSQQTPSLPDFFSCNTPGCQQREHIPITCAKCLANFCFAHRFAEDHNCSALASERVAEPTSLRKQPDINLPDTVIPPVQPPKPKKTLNAMALKLNAMKLKMNAVGENQILENHRFYVEVIFFDKKTKAVFVEDEWSFGRASESIKRVLKVDSFHEKAKLRNAKKLDEPIAADRIVKDVIENGDTLEFVQL